MKGPIVEEPVVIDLDEYFAEHPDEENEFIDEMARLSNVDEVLEYPEDW